MNIAEQVTQLKTDFDEVYEAGYAAGQSAGGDTDAAYQQGVTDGKQAEYDAFWENYQNGGSRTNYAYGFAGNGWTNDTFKPKYSMRPLTAASMFANSKIKGDLTEILDGLGVELTFANSVSHASLFQGSVFTAIGDVNLNNSSALSNMFTGCTTLKKIGIITVKSTQSLGTFLNGATALEEVQLAGEIGKTGFVVSFCSRLTHDSLMSIINCLVDYSGSTSTYKITLGSTNLAKLTDDEKLQIEAKGWTYA